MRGYGRDEEQNDTVWDWGNRLRQRLQRTLGSIQRGLGHAGPDRDSLLLIVKSVIAATIAWLLAHTVLQAPSATFAPFSALLMVQATIARSVDRALRYAVAVVVGVALTGVVIPLFGPALWTFAALLLVALAIGRWPKLGSQGSQVAVAALFAFASFTAATDAQSRLTQLASIAGLVVLGCAVGVLTNILIMPPLRYRSAEYGVSVLSRSLCDLVSDIARGLREGVPDRDEAEAWMRRADRLPDAIAQARHTVEHAAETVKLNPRRLIMHGSSSFEGYRAIINALHRASEQVCAMTKALNQAAQQDGPTGEAHERFLHDYARLLDSVAEAVRTLGNLHTMEDLRDESKLDHRLRDCREAFDALVERAEGQQLDASDQWPVYSGLHTDAYRLIQEFIQAQHELAELIREGSDQQPAR